MIYDLITIGGGPAGMLASARAAENGARVLLLEKNNKLGIKLLITGKGRCNITNADFDQRSFIDKFGSNGKFLFSAFNKFNNEQIINFFNSRGLEVQVERGNRVFPVTNKAGDVLNILIDYLKQNKVEIKTNSEVKDIVLKDNKIEKIILKNGEEFKAEKYLICTGGKSYPLTGSTGDAYAWLEKMGHTIIKPTPALVPIICEQNFIKDLEGLSLKNVNISIFQNNKKVDSRFGEAIFTANGLSGPIILDMSKNISELLNSDKVNLEIDFKPALEFETLDKRIQRDFSEAKNKMFKNSLNQLLPQKLIPIVIKLSQINPDKQVNSITKEERKKLLHLLKNFSLDIKKIDGFNKAIITSGGVDLHEVDPKTMQSKIIDNLYLAGEVLNLDGPTGGYNLQVCWSTAYSVAENFKQFNP